MKQNFENDSATIITLNRPLIELDIFSIRSMIKNSEVLARQAAESEDQESFSTRLLWVTSQNLLERALHEITQRN